MTIWGLAAAAYGLVLAFAALTQPIQRRPVALAAALAFTLAAVAAGTLTGAFWVNLLVPGGLLLAGYWLSGFYFRDPQPWLESWLWRVDHSFRAARWMHWAPRPIAELLELSYAMAYVVVGGGAIYAATFGTDAVVHYWGLVLASELASYAPLPWLRSRPPRMVGDGSMPGLKPGPGSDSGSAAVRESNVEPGSVGAPGPAAAADSAEPGFSPAKTRRVALRRLNTVILNAASVQANTLPSGHVAGAVAAALGVMAVDVVTGWWLLVAAALIAIAAIAGRYHYVIDCLTGAAVAVIFWLLM